MIEFPCDFPIKIIFKNIDNAAGDLISIVRRHHPELLDTEIKQQNSNKGNYSSMTVNVQAKSQETLDALYQELTQHPHIKMVL